jgi:hypothetical protein
LEKHGAMLRWSGRDLEFTSGASRRLQAMRSLSSRPRVRR